jgi:hypothetical protein
MRHCKSCNTPIIGTRHYCNLRCHLLAFIERDGECWLWLGAINRRGYPYVKWRGRARRAHRLAYAEYIGPIPDGLELDHECKRKRCINPWHLAPVTHAVNMARGIEAIRAGVIRRTTAKTHCRNGHAFTAENTRIVTRRDGRRARQCRICQGGHNKNRKRNR